MKQKPVFKLNLSAKNKDVRIMDSYANFVAPFVLDPNAKYFEPAVIARALSKTVRFWGQALKDYSVAEHCLNLATIMRNKYPDKPELEVLAIIHEFFETYTGDIPTPFKNEIQGLREFEDKKIVELAQFLGIFIEELPYELLLEDKMLMIEEAKMLMPLPGFWDEYAKKFQKQFNREYKPYPKEILQLREEPLKPNEAMVLFAKEWARLTKFTSPELKRIIDGDFKLDPKEITFESKVQEDPTYLQYVPKKYQTEDMCMDAAQQNIETLSMIKDKKMRTDIAQKIFDKISAAVASNEQLQKNQTLSAKIA